MQELRTQSQRPIDATRRISPTVTLVHDIRSPLSVVVGALQELSAPDLTYRERVFLVELALRSSHQVLALADDILASNGKRLPAAPQLVDMAQLVCSIVRSMRHREDARRLHLVAAPQGTVYVAGRYRDLTRLVGNLVDNAIRHASAAVHVRARREGEEVVVAVEDDGPGIAPEIAAHLFQPWQTNSRGLGGTGLGLAIVHRIAHAHGGTVRAENRDEGGARFVLRLPRIETA